MTKSEYLQTVRDQYEDYPYPERDPASEKERLITTKLDSLGEINHFGFRGKADLNNFRVLVAGGGTGDATIYLAEQLRGFNGSVVYVDISQASMAIAKERARIRGLDNITWIHASLLELPSLELEPFDYINCSGVLHHLADPDQGLSALREVLKPSGLIGLLLYGKIGRTAIYQMQDLMHLVNTNEDNVETKITNTKEVLDQLPASNWFKKSEDLITDHTEFGDIGIYDLFLHSQDRAYTIGEIYEFLQRGDLYFSGHLYGSTRYYQPETWLRKGPMLDSIKKLPRMHQESISELITGNVHIHLFYASREEKLAPDFGDKDNVPYFMLERSGDIAMNGAMIVDALSKSPDGQITLNNPMGGSFSFKAGGHNRVLIGLIDGMRSIQEIIDTAHKSINNPKPDRAVLHNALGAIFNFFHGLGWMLLRHKSLPAFKTGKQLQSEFTNREQTQ